MSEETDHYFKVFVSGYVFLNLPKTTPAEHVIWKARGAAEEGDLDVANAVIEEEFDD